MMRMPIPPFAVLAALLCALSPARAQMLPGQTDQPEDMAAKEDPVTEAQVLELRENGLIARQAEISEGLLLMDRQVRQAQMAQQLLSLFGPDTPIEIAPGEYRDFSDTPLGMEERIAKMELELRLLEVAAELDAARAQNRRAGSLLTSFLTPRAPAAAPSAAEPDQGGEDDPVTETAEPAPAPAPQPAVEYDLSVRELRGGVSGFSALLRIEGQDVLVAEGDKLEEGIVVVAVEPGQVVLRMPGGRLRSLTPPN